MKLDNAINNRVSMRGFTSKKVRWDLVLEAIDAASKVPFAGNIDNLKYIIVQDQDLKDQIATHCQQNWIADAGIIIVLCSDESILEKMYFERGLVYSRQQAGAAIQNFLLKITDLGLDSCWVGAYADELIKQLLKIPEYINIEAVLPVGYGKGKPRKIKKSPLETKIFWDQWQKKGERQLRGKKPIYFKDAQTW